MSEKVEDKEYSFDYSKFGKENGRISLEMGSCEVWADDEKEARKFLEEELPRYKFDLKKIDGKPIN